MQVIVIDERIRSHLPSLSAEELRQLEDNILRDGCLYPLILWNDVLVDGHNRYAICTKHGLPFETEQRQFADIDEVIAWVEDFQAGRRNVSPDWFAYYLGRKYEREKKAHGGDREARAQNGPLKRTSELVAEQHGVSKNTVKRAAEFARDVDAIADAIGDAARSEILDGQVKATREEVHAVAEALQDEVPKFSTVKEAVDWVKQHKAEKAAVKRGERLEKIAVISRGNTELNTSVRYPVIYADPPWRYESAPMGDDNRSIENHYPTMSLDEICAMPVADLAADDAMLYVWATAPKLAECMKVIEAWGFEYRTNLVWDKEIIGMGYYARNQHEILMVARRGKIPPPEAGKQPSSVHRERRGKHSAKPVFYYEMIEAAYPGLPKIELFCRSPRMGWAAWGNQSEASDAA